jgi:hypothetical protein
MKNRITSFFPSLTFSSPFLTFLFPFSSLFSRLPLSYLLLPFLTLFAGSVATAQIPSSGLVGYWPFNGNANDESGNGNNGTVNGATLTTDRFGNANSAYYFNSANSRIEVNLTPLNTAAKTISTWFKYNAVSVNDYPHLYTQGQNWNDGNVDEIHMLGLTYSQWGQQNRLYARDCGITETAYQDGQWHHLVYSVDYANNWSSMVVDGQLLVENTAMTFNRQIASFVLGNQHLEGINSGGGWNFFFNGSIDDFTLYNRILTQAELTQLYTDQTSLVEVPCTPFLGEDQTVCAGTSVTLSASGSSLACPTLPSTLQNGLVGYWPFCGNANDASGNGNNGTVNGASLTTDRFGNANSAYSFDGINDYISTNSTAGNIGTSNFSISTWVYDTNLAYVGGTLFGKRNDDANMLQSNWANSPQFEVGSGGNTYFNSQPLTGNYTGAWHNYTLTRESNSYKIYLDGVFQQSYSTQAIANINNSGPLSFGSRFYLGSPYQFFDGVIDDILFYSRALSAIEIQQVYTLGQSTYLWSTGATTASIGVTPTQTTTYTCTVTDANGNACTDSVTVFVPQITATNSTICAGQSTTLSVSGINSTATPSACPTLPSNLQSGLVGYWPFCGNANDASGNGNNGTVNGATLTTDRFGNANSAYSFDGVDDYIQTGFYGVQGGASRSVSFWAKTAGNSVNQSQDNMNVLCYGGPGSGGNFEVALNHGCEGLTLDINNGVNTRSAAVNNDTWSLFTIVFNSSNGNDFNSVLYYKNSVLLSTTCQIGTLTAINTVNNFPIVLGAYWDHVNRFFQGRLDDITLYNRALAPGEIQQLYTLGQTTYLWSNGATTSTINVSPTTTTTYTCTVTTNGVSCTDTITVVVGNPVASITPNGIVEICQGQSISLTGNGGVSYLWNTGAPTQSITVNTEATYTVTVTDANGCTDTESQLVKVNQLPIIGVNNASICPGQSATLTANGGVSYVWSPATGLSATTGSTVTASPATSTLYSVTGTGANGCTNTATAAVSVNALPTATITASSATTFCQGGSVVLTANTGTGLSYQWKLNGTNITGATSSSYTANASGSYTVVVTNSSTCSSTSTATVVTVNTLPTATITASSATTFCQGGSVVLTANTGTGLTYQWKLNGTNITGATSSSYTANASGSYTVVVTNASTCSSTSTATVVTVNALPTATITASSATTFCQGGSVVLNANTGTGLTYQWKLNGTNITGATSSSYTANASGSYTVTVTNASTCSSTSTATVITVNALPTATITPATATTFCQGGSVVLTANTGTGLTYQWKLNGTNITGATSSTYTANASGSYTVVVTNASTCSSTSTATVVTVNALPTATITSATATTFCQGGSVVLNANTGTGLTYQWKLNGTNITGATTSTYTANASGSYTVVVTNASTCSSTSTATVVTVNALPTATITSATATTFCQGGSVVLNANTGTGLTYQWFNNATAISGATSSSYTANASGSYTVVVTNTSTCSSTSTSIDVTTVPNVDYYADADGDGFGDAATLVSTCVQPQGYVTDNTDCKDNDASIFPGAQEICNDIDDDCNDLIDDGLVFMTYYADTDGDSFGDANNPLDACLLPDGYVTNNTDCNDSNANQNAASTEICNGEDDDCDGTIDNGLVFLDYYADLDSDGFGAGAATNSCVDLGAGYVTNNTDCNDNNVNQNAASSEICNGEDDDCDGAIDNGLIFLDYYLDVDGDGFGAGDATSSCNDLGSGYSENSTDCDDTNSNTNPNATELCNTIDDNCDGQIDEGVQTVYFIDNDGDTYGNPSVSILACTQPIGYTPDDTDCNDNDASINPGAEDLGGNGIDENCDGEIDNSIFELNASINLYPNPTRSELNIQISNALVGNDMYIFDAVGQLVYKQQLLSTQTRLSMSDYANGNYIFRIGEVVKRITIEK